MEASRREVVDCPAVLDIGAATAEPAAPRANAARKAVVGAVNRRRRMGRVLTGSPLDTGPPSSGRPPEPTGWETRQLTENALKTNRPVTYRHVGYITKLTENLNKP